MKEKIITFLEEYQQRAHCLVVTSASYQQGWNDCLQDMINAAKELPSQSAPNQDRALPNR